MYSHSILLWIAVDIATIPPEEAEKVAVLWVDVDLVENAFDITHDSYWLLHNTSTMLFVRCRPWRRCLLRICLQFPRYSRKQLLSFPAFLGDTLHGAECTTRVNYLFKFFGWNFLRVTSADNITHKGQVICLIFAVRLEPSFQFLETFQNDFLVVMQHN